MENISTNQIVGILFVVMTAVLIFLLYSGKLNLDFLYNLASVIINFTRGALLNPSIS